MLRPNRSNKGVDAGGKSRYTSCKESGDWLPNRVPKLGNYVMETITDVLAQLKIEHPEADKRVLTAHLTIAGFTPKDISEVFPKEPKKPSFREAYYDYLVENTPTEAEAEAFILGHELLTPNIEKHLSAFKRDAALVLRVKEAVSE